MSMLWRLWAFPLIFFSTFANAQTWQAQNEEEALFLRRIASFWEEGEYQIVKGQIEEFLKEYPDSSFSQSLSATLGDLYIREKNFQGALMQYSRITDPDIATKVFLSRMQCLLDLQWFSTLADECEAFLQKPNIEPDLKLRATYLLAIALYQQCLNTPKDSETLTSLAQRAQPYFQTLLQSELSNEVAQAFAHLCFILKDYASASEIYLRLAKEDHANEEELLFQAAILQAHYDKMLAMNTFEGIVSLGKMRSSDAIYNRLVLSYELGKHEELIAKKEELLPKIPLERRGAAHLFFGRSHLALKQDQEALNELLLYAEGAPASELLRAALVDIIEISYRLSDEPKLAKALQRLKELFPEDQQIPKGILAHALLLKKNQRYEEARQELDGFQKKFADFAQIETVLFEQLQLEFQEKRWEGCRSICHEYLNQFSKSNLASYVWRFLASASSHWAAEANTPAAKEQLASDLESLLSHDAVLSIHEQNDWHFLLAKTNYELKRYRNAIQSLEALLFSDPHFTQAANAHLLLGLCYRDGLGDFDRFCQEAEAALQGQANLFEETAQHIALFNGYLAMKNPGIAQGAEHLYIASQKESIQPDNLLWLAEYYYGESLREPNKTDVAKRAAEMLEKFFSSTRIDIRALDESSLQFEGAVVKLAELEGRLGHENRQAQLLENLQHQREAHKNWAWQEESKSDWLLAQNYAKSGQEAKALQLFDQVVARNPTMRTFTSASAALDASRLRIARWAHRRPTSDNPDFVKVLSLLKTLILQKTLANEPIHLEAAIEYIDLQTRLEKKNERPEKRLALLTKAKADFETTDDLLSLDYQKSRKKLPEKNLIYQAYMRLIDGEILFCRFLLSNDETERAQLKDLAKKCFQEILSEPITSFLKAKAANDLERLEGK
jgi:hypothetical protein